MYGALQKHDCISVPMYGLSRCTYYHVYVLVEFHCTYNYYYRQVAKISMLLASAHKVVVKKSDLFSELQPLQILSSDIFSVTEYFSHFTLKPSKNQLITYCLSVTFIDPRLDNPINPIGWN